VVRAGLKVLTSMVVAGAMLLSFSTGASASVGGTVSGGSPSVIEAQRVSSAKALGQKVYDEKLKSLLATGSATYTDVHGTSHRIQVTSQDIVIDGKSEATGRSTAVHQSSATAQVASSIWCNAKVAAAIAALATIGVAYIVFMITGLSEGVTVAIVGISLTVVQWQAVIAIMAAGGSLVGVLKLFLC
jgi:hypothetical protein